MAGRTEARVFTSIWRDRYFLSLDEGAQRLYLFLLSQEDLTYSGVLPLRPNRWAKKALGLTTEAVETHLKVLEGTAYPTANPDPESGRTPLLVIDRDSEEVLIRSLMRRDGIWKQPNLLKVAMESAEQVESPRIRGALLAELNRLPLEETGSAQVRTLVAEFIAIMEKSGPYPTPYPPPDPSGYPPDKDSADPTGQDYARAQGSGGSVTVDGGSPDPLFPVPQTPLAGASDRKQGHRLPDDFVVTPEMRAWAAEKTPSVDVDREFERFCDHWHSKPGREGRKLDWRLTWNNWMRNAQDRQGPRDRGDRRQQVVDGKFERALQRAAAKERGSA